MELPDIDVLMITYNRPEYTRLALPRLLETCSERMGVWIWHNGDNQQTLDIVKAALPDARVRGFHHSPQNQRLREPTNWFWRTRGSLLGKVDDDCLVPPGWADTLRRAHVDVPRFGIVCCWPFLEEDFNAGVAGPKIRGFGCGHQLLQNLWVGGSGYLMKREVLDKIGPLRTGESFTAYCLRAASAGWLNGWYYPLIYQDHMEDPRSPYTTMRTEADFLRRPPLSARRFSTDSFDDLRQRAAEAAREVQKASLNLRHYVGWRARLRRAAVRLSGRGRVVRFDA